MTTTSRSRLVVDPTHDGMAPGAARSGARAELRATGPTLDEDEFVDVGPGAVLHTPALPDDAQGMGLSAWTAPELALASSLNPRRRGARLVAWFFLVVFVGPVLFSLVETLGRHLP